jgi:hypothetical protein
MRRQQLEAIGHKMTPVDDKMTAWMTASDDNILKMLLLLYQLEVSS